MVTGTKRELEADSCFLLQILLKVILRFITSEIQSVAFFYIKLLVNCITLLIKSVYWSVTVTHESWNKNKNTDKISKQNNNLKKLKQLNWHKKLNHTENISLAVLLKQHHLGVEILVLYINNLYFNIKKLSSKNIVSVVFIFYFRASAVCSAHLRWSGFSVWVGLLVNWITTLSMGRLYWSCSCVFLVWLLIGWPAFGMVMLF